MQGNKSSRNRSRVGIVQNWCEFFKKGQNFIAKLRDRRRPYQLGRGGAKHGIGTKRLKIKMREMTCSRESCDKREQTIWECTATTTRMPWEELITVFLSLIVKGSAREKKGRESGNGQRNHFLLNHEWGEGSGAGEGRVQN